MPRNYDEAVEWPDEVVPDLAEVVRNLELVEDTLDAYFDPLED
jgi:hypothetical protein